MPAITLIALYIVKKKNWKFFELKKNAKMTRRFYGYKGSANTYNVEILNSIILNMQLEVS